MMRWLTLPLCCAILSGCGYWVARELSGAATAVPNDFTFLDETHPCYLEIHERRKAIRVNCFSIEGDLHIHSSRWAKMPRFSGENWTVTVARVPEVRVQIDENIYEMVGIPITDQQHRDAILRERGYWILWDGITIFRFLGRDVASNTD